MNKEKEIEKIIESIYGLVLEAKEENDILEKLEDDDKSRISSKESNKPDDNNKILFDEIKNPKISSSDQVDKNKYTKKFSDLDFKKNTSTKLTDDMKVKNQNPTQLQQLHEEIELIFKRTLRKYIQKKINRMIERQFSYYSKKILEDKLK